MKLRLLSFILCVLMLFSFSGCFLITKENTETTNTEKTELDTSVDMSKYIEIDRSLVDYRTSLYNGVDLTKGYESLNTDEQRKCYELIDENVVYISKETTDSYYTIAPVYMQNVVFSEAQIHLIISAYTMDHPEIFWVDSRFSYEVKDGTTILYLNSGMNADAVKTGAAKMGEEIAEIFNSVTGGLSQYQREIEIHDALLTRCEYSDNTEAFNVYTSLGAIVDGEAVCEGYSRAMQILLSMAGVETYYVFGTGSEELHMWNVVNIDGIWFHLDPTWDDQDRGVIYDYFNLTQSEITRDHTLSPYYWELTEDEVCGGDSGLAASFNIFIPDSSTGGGSYYSQNAVTVSGYDASNIENVAQGFISALDRGEDFLYIYIDPAHLNYDKAVDNLFYKGDYMIFKCIDEANSQIYYTQIYDESVEVTEIEEENIVCVYFEQD